MTALEGVLPSSERHSFSLAAAPTVTVVIPAKNEALNLPHVLSQMPAGIDEVILVDGHSVDDTIAVALECLPSIRVVEQVGIGKGDALRAGFAAATSDIIVMVDCDGSTHLGEIPRFLEPLLVGADYAKGSRFLPGGGSADITPLRQLGNSVLSGTVNLLFGSRYTDLCYGYNAFWRSCLDALMIDCDGFEVETLMNIRARSARLKVVEVPSFEAERMYGKSNLNVFRDGKRVLKTIVRERLRRHPKQIVALPIDLDVDVQLTEAVA